MNILRHRKTKEPACSTQLTTGHRLLSEPVSVTTKLWAVGTSLGILVITSMVQMPLIPFACRYP